MAANNARSLYSIALQKPPSSIISLNTAVGAMPINDINNTLLLCPDENFLLVDEQGNKLFNIKRNFKVSDICFSSFLEQFLILSMEPDDYTLHSLDPSTRDLKQITKSDKIMWTCTCFNTIFIVSEAYKDSGSDIAVYDLCQGWTPIKTFTPPLSCKADHQIEKIRFNNDGSRLGMILRQKRERAYQYWFELRDSIDMTIVVKTNINPDGDTWCWLLALPNQQFLATLQRQKTFFLFNSNGQLQETNRYDYSVRFLNSVALLSNKWLVVQTWKPNELRFHKL